MNNEVERAQWRYVWLAASSAAASLRCALKRTTFPSRHSVTCQMT
jgi:hypothetical protein